MYVFAVTTGDGSVLCSAADDVFPGMKAALAMLGAA